MAIMIINPEVYADVSVNIGDLSFLSNQRQIHTSELNNWSEQARMNTEHGATGTRRWKQQMARADTLLRPEGNHVWMLSHRASHMKQAPSPSQIGCLSSLSDSTLPASFQPGERDMTSSFRLFPKANHFRCYHRPSVSHPTSQSVIPHSSCRNAEPRSDWGLVLST